jgi:hypothetical protein
MLYRLRPRRQRGVIFFTNFHRAPLASVTLMGLHTPRLEKWAEGKPASGETRAAGFFVGGAPEGNHRDTEAQRNKKFSHREGARGTKNFSRAIDCSW